MITNLLRLAAERGERVGLHHKVHGEWYGFTFARALSEVKLLAHALASLGFAPGDRLAVGGDVRPRLLFAAMAAQALGGDVVSIEGSEAERTPVRIAFVRRRAEAERIRATEPDSAPRFVIHEEARSADHEHAVTYAEARRDGQRHLLQHPHAFSGWVARHRDSEAAVVAALSGRGKAEPDDRVLVDGNFHSPATRLLVLDLWPAIGFSLVCPESAKSVEGDRIETKPTYLFGASDHYERLWQLAASRLPRLGSRSRALIDGSGRGALSATPLIGSGLRSALDRVAASVLRRRVRERLGLSQVRAAAFVGDPPAPAALGFLSALGIRLDGEGAPGASAKVAPDDGARALIANFG